MLSMTLVFYCRSFHVTLCGQCPIGSFPLSFSLDTQPATLYISSLLLTKTGHGRCGDSWQGLLFLLLFLCLALYLYNKGLAVKFSQFRYALIGDISTLELGTEPRTTNRWQTPLMIDGDCGKCQLSVNADASLSRLFVRVGPC